MPFSKDTKKKSPKESKGNKVSNNKNRGNKSPNKGKYNEKLNKRKIVRLIKV